MINNIRQFSTRSKTKAWNTTWKERSIKEIIQTMFSLFQLFIVIVKRKNGTGPPSNTVAFIPPHMRRPPPRPKGCWGHAQDPSARNVVPHTSPRHYIYCTVYKTYTEFENYIDTHCLCEFGVWCPSYPTLECWLCMYAECADWFNLGLWKDRNCVAYWEKGWDAS
jgi:hypothetical protein